VSSAEEPKELAAKIRGSAATTKEVKALCEDLQVRVEKGGGSGVMGGWGTVAMCGNSGKLDAG
jgi:hypothetical protein